MESTRAMGYSLEAAVADIIDNSVAAGATRVDIQFSPYDAVPYVSILDNGMGMTSDEINDAMRYGSQSSLNERQATDLGRFGLGLKTASLSQCRCLTVISKQGRSVQARRWDLDEVYEKWKLMTTHVGRKTFICNSLMLGIAPQIVMKWTGHSDYAAMKPYIEIADKAKEDAMSLFDAK